MRLGEYIDRHIATGETFVGIDGWKNNVECDLIQASRHVPAEHWGAEILKIKKEGAGRIIWVSKDAQPDYTIHKTI